MLEANPSDIFRVRINQLKQPVQLLARTVLKEALTENNIRRCLVKLLPLGDGPKLAAQPQIREQGSQDLAAEIDQDFDEQELFAVAAEPNFSGLRW